MMQFCAFCRHEIREVLVPFLETKRRLWVHVDVDAEGAAGPLCSTLGDAKPGPHPFAGVSGV